MKKYNRFNFFKHTFCDWKLIDQSFIKDKTPDYKSQTGSAYYFDEQGLARYSDHWGRAANCRWRLIKEDKNNKGFFLGYAKWVDFYPNDEKSDLFAIIYNPENQSVDFAHKQQITQGDMLFRNASQTSKRIAKIKQIIQDDSWYKHLEHMDYQKAKDFIINQLIYSNEEFVSIKKKLLSP
ncbi:hypothetical protein [Myroides sp. LJL119]